jgi:pilus assembly protein CpaE
MSDAVMPDPAALVHLLDQMREHFEIVMQEIPRHMVGQYPFLLAESSQIVLVADMTLASVRDTIRMLGHVKDIAPKVPLTLIGNKSGPQTDVSQKDFEHAIERPLDLLIPYDPKTAMAAAKSAKMLAQVAKGSKTVAGVKTLAQRVTGSGTAKAAQPFWKALTQAKAGKTARKA